MRLLLLLLFNVAAFSMSLQEAIRIAEQKSPLLLKAKISAKEAKYNKKAAAAKNFGQIRTTASYTHYNIPRTLSPLVPPLTSPITVSKEITSASILYSVTLFNGFADTSEVKISELGQKIALLKAKLTKAELVYNIKSLYFGALEAKKRLEATQSYIKALKELERKTALEVKLGKKAKLDLYKVQNELEGAYAKQTALQADLTTLRSALAATVGIKKIDTLEEAKETLLPAKEKLSLQIAKLNIAKSKKAFVKSKALYYPKIELRGSYAKNFAQESQAELWQGSVNLSYTLFDFGLRRSIAQKAKLQELKARYELTQTKLLHQADLVKAKEEIKKALANITRFTMQKRLTHKIAQAEAIRYQTGASDMSDYLQALANLHQADANLQASYYQLYRAYAYLNFIQESGK